MTHVALITMRIRRLDAPATQVTVNVRSTIFRGAAITDFTMFVRDADVTFTWITESVIRLGQDEVASRDVCEYTNRRSMFSSLWSISEERMVIVINPHV